MTPIEKYFNAEKYESLLFVFVGLVAVAMAAYFLFKIRQPYYNGVACSLIGIALIQLTVGTSVYFRSPKDIVRVNHLVSNQRDLIQKEEIPRMETVMKNFVLYRWIEIALIAVGLILFFAIPDKTIWKGIGLGLAIQAAFMLLLDFFAESRGKIYIDYLQNLIK